MHRSNPMALQAPGAEMDAFDHSTSQMLTMPMQEVTASNCLSNVTAQTGLTASMFCCLGCVNKDLGVSTDY